MAPTLLARATTEVSTATPSSSQPPNPQMYVMVVMCILMVVIISMLVAFAVAFCICYRRRRFSFRAPTGAHTLVRAQSVPSSLSTPIISLAELEKAIIKEDKAEKTRRRPTSSFCTPQKFMASGYNPQQFAPPSPLLCANASRVDLVTESCPTPDGSPTRPNPPLEPSLALLTSTQTIDKTTATTYTESVGTGGPGSYRKRGGAERERSLDTAGSVNAAADPKKSHARETFGVFDGGLRASHRQKSGAATMGSRSESILAPSDKPALSANATSLDANESFGAVTNEDEQHYTEWLRVNLPNNPSRVLINSRPSRVYRPSIASNTTTSTVTQTTTSLAWSNHLSTSTEASTLSASFPPVPVLEYARPELQHRSQAPKGGGHRRLASSSSRRYALPAQLPDITCLPYAEPATNPSTANSQKPECVKLKINYLPSGSTESIIVALFIDIYITFEDLCAKVVERLSLKKVVISQGGHGGEIIDDGEKWATWLGECLRVKGDDCEEGLNMKLVLFAR
ncbi:hypothetical protein BOTBODRAFT_180451 [Botryobasidium botryosum FD-172 SS1]|uniref:Uncharacterized protein n=1 Tax=Botryobasidium botryosum (strain FD-172 SS1) TaxID=930990 RepID=A0A067M880_BOTB1|nr:hypothetical protein BOTBODRAFT_180451 [Botryobasidium botryosum FD-172 SS1]